ncbi:MAG: prepilin-type N-terminal cleavage/methylation domain-containing protein [Bryobacterales bacterium]|nr:prepilin-type N-terminal cleavage/methylation domain-containing protein [Bryobacterales bacterium]
MSGFPSRHRNNKAVSAGMTLIEVVLALALLGLVSTGLLAVTGNGLRAWLDSREALRQDRRLSNASIRLHETIAAMVPMPAMPQSGSLDAFPFFEGEQRFMRFVSGHSPTRGSRAGMRLVSLSAHSFEGALTLLLTETACPGPRGLASLLPAVPGRQTGQQARPFIPAREAGESWTVVENLTACEFSYLRGSRVPNEAAEWVQHWQDRGTVPRAVRIEWTEKSGWHGSSLFGGRSITAAVLAEPEPSGRRSAW